MTDRMIPDSVSGASSAGPAGGGLAREMGFFSVLVFSIASIGLAISGQIPFSTIAGIWPGGSLVVILGVALIPCLVHGYMYAVIGAAAPQSGADYVVARRALSAPLAFASSWTFVIVSALTAGSLIAMIPQLVIPIFFRMFGMVGEHVPVMIRMADDARSPENVVLIGTIFVVITFLLILLPPRVVLHTLQVGFFVILAAWGVILFTLATSDAAAVPMAWDRVMGTGSYLEHLNRAKSLGFDAQAGSSYVLAAGLFVSFWVYFGYAAPALMAGEVKKPARNLLGGSLLALVLTGGIFVAAASLMLRLVPAEWLSAESFLYQSGGDLLAMPWIMFYAAVLRPNPALMVFVFVAWVYSIVNMAQTYFFFASRVMLAWKEDGLLPEIMGYIHPGLRSPLMMVLLVAILAEGGVVFASLNITAVSQVNFAVFIAAAQIVPALAVTVFPFTQREWFRSSNRLVRASIGPLPVITLVGGLTCAYLVWLLVSSLMTPVQGGVGAGTLIAVAVMFASGLAWYGLRRMAARPRRAAEQSLTG